MSKKLKSGIKRYYHGRRLTNKEMREGEAAFRRGFMAAEKSKKKRRFGFF